MYKTICFSMLMAAGAMAANMSPVNILKRQDGCSEMGMKVCGEVCIDLTDTCCPDAAGGCPLGTYCSLGSNGEYGCCDNGEVCEGPGGAITTPGDIITSTETIVVPEPTAIETETETETLTDVPEPTATVPEEPSSTPDVPPEPTPTETGDDDDDDLPTATPTDEEPPPEFTGAADSNLQKLKLAALALPLLVL